MLAWEGEPISEGLDDVDKIERTVENYGNLIDQALRRNFSPNGVLRNIMIDTVVVNNTKFIQKSISYEMYADGVTNFILYHYNGGSSHHLQLAGQVFFWVASAYVGEVVNRNGDRNFKE